MRISKCLWAGLAALAATAVARAQMVSVSLPAGSAVPLVSAAGMQPAPAELLLQQQAAQHASELGLPALAAELYRELLATPGGGDHDALTLALVTALLNDGQDDRIGEAAQALQGIPAAQRGAAWHLRAGLIDAVQKNFNGAQAEAALVKADQLSAADRGWFYFLQGQVVEAGGDAQKAQALYDQAVDAAVSDQERAQFALAKSQTELRAGPPKDGLMNELQHNVDKYQGTLTGYRYARQYAVALNAAGRKIDAVSLLRQQLLALPPGARTTADDFRLLLGLIAGPDTEPGRQALTELLRNGSDPLKQRIALQLLGRAASQPGPQRDAFRRLLDELIAASPPHPILDELLLFHAQMNLADKKYPLAMDDAQALLTKFPGSALKPAALGVELGVVWEERRWRLAADYATKARDALPPGRGELHAQLNVLVAEAWFRAGDFRNAADAYAAVLNERPAGIDAGALIFQRVQAEIEAGRLDTAQALADQFAGEPDFARSENRWKMEWNLARALEAQGETKAALARVERLLGATGAAGLSTDLRVRMAWLQAHLAFEGDQPEQALKLAGALADSLAGAGGAGVPEELKTTIISLELLQEAEADFKLQRADAALELLKKLRVDYPRSEAAVYSYIVEARFDTDKNDLVNAQVQLTRLADAAEADKAPGSPYTYYAPYALYLAALNAESLGQDTNLEEANRFIERLVSKYPDSDLVFYARLKQGDLFRKLNQFGPAQHAYEDLVNKYPQHADVLVAQMALADCHSAQAANDPAHAESAAVIYESLQDRPDAPAELRVEAGCKLGRSQMQRGQLADAQKTWWQLVNGFLLDESKAASLGATGRYWMGRVLLELGDSLEQEQTESALEQAREAWLLIERYQLPGLALAQARLARYLPAEARP